jgi:AraC-like DNA-binding protein
MAKSKIGKFSITNIRNEEDAPYLKNFVISKNHSLAERFPLNESFIVNEIIMGLCLKGNAKLKINFKEYNLKSNSVLVIIPNQIITILEESDDSFMEYLFVSVDFIIDFPLPRDFDLLSNIEQWCCMEISSCEMENLLDYYSMIIKQYNQIEQSYCTEIIKSLFYAMLLKMTGIYALQEKLPKVPSSRTEKTTDDFFRLLMTHYKQERNIVFYADKLYMTSKHLSSIIKKMTGKAALSWIHETIIAESKMLLKTTDMTILQISNELSFPNPSFFGKFFKQHTGITPAKFRKTN